MISSKLEHTKYSSISPRERELLVNLEGAKVFTPHDIIQILGCSRNYSYQILSRLVRKKIAKRVARGKYVLLSLQGMDKTDLLSQASNLVWPSYISMWTALGRYHLTESLPNKIHVVASRQRKNTTLEGVEIVFIKLSKEGFFGYARSDGVFIADVEKALLDSLLLPQYAGGIREVFKCLRNAWPNLDRKKLVDYALRMDSKVLAQRLGYLIEKGGLEIEEGLLEELHQAVGQSYSKLDPNLGKGGKFKNRWKLMVNVELGE